MTEIQLRSCTRAGRASDTACSQRHIDASMHVQTRQRCSYSRCTDGSQSSRDLPYLCTRDVSTRVRAGARTTHNLQRDLPYLCTSDDRRVSQSSSVWAWAGYRAGSVTARSRRPEPGCCEATEQGLRLHSAEQPLRKENSPGLHMNEVPAEVMYVTPDTSTSRSQAPSPNAYRCTVRIGTAPASLARAYWQLNWSDQT